MEASVMLGRKNETSRTRSSARNRTKLSAQVALEFVVLEDRAIPSVTGIVYQDYNANGTFDTNGQVPNAGLGTSPTAIDRVISGILVTAYDANNAVVTQATSDSTGAYSLNTSNSGPLRVEFTNLPAGVFFGPQGTSANTAVQFVPAGNASNVNLSLVRPEDFSPDNPLLVTSMYVFGGITPNDFSPGTGVVVSFPNASGSEDADKNQANHRNPTTHDLSLRYDNVGTTWGLTYDRVQNKIYAASYAKRHTSFGPNGPGAIYQSGTSGTGGTLFADLNAIFPNNPAGNLLDVFRDQNNNPVPFRQNYTTFLDYARDGLVRFVDSTGVTRDLGWDTVGKIALGGLDVNADASRMFTVALGDRRLYSVPTSGVLNSSTVQRFDLPLPAGVTGRTVANPLGDLRPFAVQYHRGLVYIGALNSAETSQRRQDLKAYVFAFDPAKGTFVNLARQSTTTEAVFEISLNYERGIIHMGGNQNGNFPNGIAPPDPAEWNPWSPTFRTVAQQPEAIGRASYPQPMLTGLSFDVNGNISLGIRDRSSDQFGRLTPDDPTQPNNFSFFGIPAGDTLRAFINTNGNLDAAQANPSTTLAGWTLESNGRNPNGTIGTGPQNTGQGPGGAEFYFSDELPRDPMKPPVGVQTEHDEVSLGGILQIPGFNQLATTAFDPVRIPGAVNTGGVRWFDSTTGGIQRSYELYFTPIPDANTTFAKANGVGDLIAVTAPPPIEIGNYIWNDTNKNGVQDAGEAPLAGVEVQLFTDANVSLGTATTDANGNYYFSSLAGVSTPSKIVGLNLLQNTQYQLRINLGQTSLAKKQLTTANANSGANSDTRDSDATVVGSSAVVDITTGFGGQSNHTFDVGFFNKSLVSLGNFVWDDVNNDGIKGPNELGIGNVFVNLYDATGTTKLATTITSAQGIYNFSELDPGTYVVEIAAPAGYSTSTGKNGSATGPYEPGISTNTDNQDHGTLQPNGLIRSAPVTLAVAGNPANPNTTGTLPNDANTTIDFGLFRPMQVGNFVWEDVNNNGVFDSGEKGIAGVGVQLLDDKGVVLSSTITNASGGYLFGRLGSKSYSIRIFTPTGYTSSTGRNGSSTGPFEPGIMGNLNNADHGTNNGIVITAAPFILGVPGTNPDGAGFANFRQDFGLFRPMQVGNFVWEDTNNNGILDSGEKGISGVSVQLLDANGTPLAGTITNGDGNYLFGGLGSGAYSVRVFAPNGFRSSTGKNGSLTGPFEPGVIGNANNTDHGTTTGGSIGAAPFTLTAPGTNPDDAGLANLRQDFGLFRPLSIGNFVWDDANNNGVFDGGESGIGNVPVDLLDANGTVIGNTITSAGGNYNFGDLAVGTYSVRITTPTGYQSSTGKNGFATGPFEPGTEGNLDNADHGTTAGGFIVAVPFGLLAPGANPDADGLANLRQDFGLFRPLSIGNLVWFDVNNNGKLDAGEKGIANIAVRLLASNGVVLANTTTDTTGDYRFTNLATGTYSVEIDRPTELTSSTGTSGQNTGPFEPAVAGNANDSEDKGTGFGGVIRTSPFTLDSFGTNPDLAGSANLRQDFGLTTIVVPPPPPPPATLPASVSGYVYRDTFVTNGVRQPASGESGIAGTLITLTGFDANGLPLTRTAITDINGFYKFPNLSAGSYTIRETQPQGFIDGIDTPGSLGGSTPSNDVLIVGLVAGQDGVEYNFGEVLMSSVFGFAYEDINRNRRLDVGEPGIPNVIITISGTAFEGTPMARPLVAADSINGLVTSTNASGRYEFPVLPPGRYTITEAQPADFQDFFESAQEPTTKPVNLGNDIISEVSVAGGEMRGALNFGEVRSVGPITDPTKQNFLGSSPNGGTISVPPSTTPPVSVLPNNVPLDPKFAVNTGNPGKASLLAVGAGAGRGPSVRVFDYATSTEKFRFFAYEESFTGGVRTAVADVDGDGTPDIITATGVGGGPRIRVFSGVNGAPIRDYFAFEPEFRGGVFVAAGDVNGDGKADIIVGPEVGGGPRVTTFDGSNGAILNNFFAFDPNQRGGVRVAVADFTNDGAADIVVATGNSVATRVRTFDGRTLSQLSEIAPYAANFTGGVFVAAGDVNGDGVPDIVTAADIGGGPHVQVFSGTSGQAISSFFAFDAAFTGGVRVGLIDADGDGKLDIVTGAGVGMPSQIKIWRGSDITVIDDFYAFDTTFQGGIYVA